MNYTSRWTITLFSQIFVCNFLHYLVYNASVSYHWNEDSCSKIVWICVNHLENAWRIASSWKRFATIIIFIHLYNTFRSFGYWLLWEEHWEKWVSHIISHLPVYKNKSLHTQICMCACVCVCVCVCVLNAELCPDLFNPVSWSPPGFCVHGISQAKMLEWVAISSSRGSSLPRDQNPCLLHCISFAI